MNHQSDITRLYAMLSAQNFLIGQLYARLFLADPEARKNVPTALVEAAMYKTHTKAQTDEESLIEMQAQIVLELQRFFSDVEQRVKTSQDRPGQ
jgi:hypothetical protein